AVNEEAGQRTDGCKGVLYYDPPFLVFYTRFYFIELIMDCLPMNCKKTNQPLFSQNNFVDHDLVEILWLRLYGASLNYS
ncbi:MAG TPA: hypothetical protein VJ904_08525, partial [Tichowtungia sp.]|nr:hypothetical protein [Tichowtungia sp.]